MNRTMKTKHALFASALILATASQAATVVSDYDNSTGPGDPGFLYIDKVIMSTTDSWSDTASVGGWSYKNTNTGPTVNPNRGWGHTADWFLLELTNPAYVTISMVGSDPLAWAGFVIYAGESLIDDATQAHAFSNNGLQVTTLNAAWDFNGPGGTPGLAYVGHGHSATQSPDVSGTWALGAGLYTIAFGNAADSATAPTAKDFAVNITTIPEPSAALLSILAAGALGFRRRRA
jgi:hypothetical protein